MIFAGIAVFRATGLLEVWEGRGGGTWSFLPLGNPESKLPFYSKLSQICEQQRAGGLWAAALCQSSLSLSLGLSQVREARAINNTVWFVTWELGRYSRSRMDSAPTMWALLCNAGTQLVSLNAAKYRQLCQANTLRSGLGPASSPHRQTA